jgi:hypothetical protein
MRLVAAVQFLDEIVTKNDLIESTRQALGSVKTLRDAKGAELLERAKAVIEAPPKTSVFVSSPAPPPMPTLKAKRRKGGHWVCTICGVPGCLIGPQRWVSYE